MGGMISGILGGGESGAQAAQQKELAAARQAMQQYRPEAMQARINLFNNASSAYQGANNALETMYGGRSKPDPWAGAKEQLLSAQKPQVVMGHEMPQAPPMQQQPPPRRHIGDGNGWEDTAAQLIDPGGIFRRFF